jgi:Carboxypeptidase regulatory-like domain/TonB dependent receptor-like, beta-barrel
MPHSVRIALFVALLFALGIATPGFAQKTTGDITGTVTDTTGGVLPGVTVTAVCTTTNFTRTASTDAQGGFSLPDLPVCVYRVTAEIQGFKTTARDVQVAVNTVVKADFGLEVGTQAETITVEGASPLVEFSDKLNNYVDTERITEIPLSGRDFNSLLAVTPGVQRDPGGGFLAVSISGARHTSNNYMIDGISNNDRYYGDSVLNQTGVVGVPATLVPMDAIAEFTIQQTPSAEFGIKGGGAINVVMKSGTNQLHGTGYYFNHDEWTDAPNYFVKKNGGDKTPVSNQQYGGTFGGPIVKDKTFFFGYYEGQRLRVTSPYQAGVPTNAEIAEARARIAAAGLTTNSIGENLLKYYPVNDSGQLTVNSANIVDMKTFSGKIDHQLNANNRLSGRYFFGQSYQSAPAFVGELTPADGPVDMFNSVTDPTRAQLFGVVWTSTISPRSILEVRLGYNRFSQTLAPSNNTIDPKSLGLNTGPLDQADFGVPAVYMGSFGYIGGVGGYPITTSPTQTYDVSASLTQTRGRHTFKYGGNYQLGKNHSVRNRARSILTISGGGTFDDVDSLVGLLLGRWDIASRTFGSTSRDLSQYSIGGFVNDEFKMSSRLTVSFGLRYDYNSPVSERNDIASNFIPGQGLVRVGSGIDRLHDPDKNNFGPRAGIAWDITGDGRSVIRSGYALTYDLPDFKTVHSPNTTWSGLGARSGAFTNPDLDVFSVSLIGAAGNAPDSSLATCINPNTGEGGDYVCAQPDVPLYGDSPTGQPPFNAFAIPQDYKIPMYHYFHVTFQRELFRNNAVTVSYIGSRGRDQSWFRDINGPPLGSDFTNPQVNRPFYSQFPTLGHIIQLTNDGKSWYDALQLSYRQNAWHGINSQYNYTLSSCDDYNSDNSRGRNNFPQANNPYDAVANRGPCDFDRRHNFNVAGTYSLPDSDRLGTFSRGWMIGTVFTALSGRAFTANVSSRDRSGQDTGSLRADCFADPIYDFSNPDGFITNIDAAFGTPANGTLGTCGRNSVRGPGLAQWDLNILKQFHLSSSTRIEVRWEIFNLLNRLNLGFPPNTTSNVRSSLFGTIGSTPDVEAGNPVIAQGGPRAMQWAVKILF